MHPRPLVTLFGIPLSVDPFFLFGMYLMYSWSGGGRRGWFTVIALAVFVVIHELGHALTARRFGAVSAITITFLGGFASYSPSRTLKSWEQNVISVMGPVTQLVAAIPFIAIAQGIARTGDVRLAYDMYIAVTWAGVLLAFLNLVPLWPLDGGHIAERVTVKLLGAGGNRAFAIYSVAGSGLLLAAGLFSSGTTQMETDAYYRLFTGLDASLPVGLWRIMSAMPMLVASTGLFIALICLFGSVSRLNQVKQLDGLVAPETKVDRRTMAHEDAVRSARDAERKGWTDGTPGDFPRGWEPSPWLSAHLAARSGRLDEATNELARLADGGTRRWTLDRADRPEIEALLPLVPPSAAQSIAVLEARVHAGTAEDLATVATRQFELEGSAEPLYLGAAGLAARGRLEEAMAWLRGAATKSPDPHRIAITREFQVLHARSDYQQLLGEAERAVGIVRTGM